MIILVGIGCFMAGAVVGIVVMMTIQIPKIQRAYKEAYCDE